MQTFWRIFRDIQKYWCIFIHTHEREACNYFYFVYFFTYFFHEKFIEVPSVHEISPALKTYGCAPAFRHYSFSKTLHLKCLAVLWIHLCVDNCSGICTIPLLLYTTSETFRISDIFWTLFIQIYSDISKNIQHYSGIFTPTKALLRQIQVYSDIFIALIYLHPL